MPLQVDSDALVTVPFSLTASGLPPHAEVTLHAKTHDRHGEPWRSWATFRAGAEGQVDVTRQAPLTGTYAGSDAGGLLWSMRPREDLSPAFFETPPEGYRVTLQVRHKGQVVEEVCVLRRARLPHLRDEEVREEGLHGTLFSLPGQEDLRGAVLMLGGSEGGLYDTRAALLASEGFLVLNLAYFGLPGLPASLINIPLEYFHRALRHLRSRPEVAGRRVGVTGASKGAEAALLLGATYPAEVGAIAALAPSGVVFEGIDREGGHPRDQPMSSWSLGGQPLPYVPYLADWSALFAGPRPVRMTPVHEEAVRRASPTVLNAATIPVEQIQGPVLLVSGGDDQVWNAQDLSRIAERRRQRAGLWVEHLTHPRAGHALSLPGFPTFVRTPWTTMGGETGRDAHLQQRAWGRTLEVLSMVWQDAERDPSPAHGPSASVP